MLRLAEVDAGRLAELVIDTWPMRALEALADGLGGASNLPLSKAGQRTRGCGPLSACSSDHYAGRFLSPLSSTRPVTSSSYSVGEGRLVSTLRALGLVVSVGRARGGSS